MLEVKKDIWEYHKIGNYIVIPTNGFVKNNGKAVMGRGLAYQAKEKYSNLELMLGKALQERGNRVFVWSSMKLITFPVKRVWWERANLDLIEKSCKELKEIIENSLTIKSVFMPKVGCGNGKLQWEEVKGIIEYYLGSLVVICDVI